jgi:hypothetical protein
MVWRAAALSVFLFACYAVAGSVVGIENSQTAESPATTALALLLACALEAVVMAALILGSRWTGWKLIGAVFFIFYGVTTFMSQIESAVFITRLPPGTVPRLFLMGGLIAAPFSIAAVVILGKGKPKPTDVEPNARLVMPAGEWLWKLSVIAIAYLILYFTFGYFIAWRNPAVSEYYGGRDPGSFAAQISAVLQVTPWLVPLQIVRAMCWVLLALPVIRMLKGGWLETALMLGLLFAVVMNAQLLLPNPYMPKPVRMAHLMETASSNFIFGVLIGWLLTERQGVRKPAIA